MENLFTSINQLRKLTWINISLSIVGMLSIFVFLLYFLSIVPFDFLASTSNGSISEAESIQLQRFIQQLIPAILIFLILGITSFVFTIIFLVKASTTLSLVNSFDLNETFKIKTPIILTFVGIIGTFITFFVVTVLSFLFNLLSMVGIIWLAINIRKSRIEEIKNSIL